MAAFGLKQANMIKKKTPETKQIKLLVKKYCSEEFTAVD